MPDRERILSALRNACQWTGGCLWSFGVLFALVLVPFAMIAAFVKASIEDGRREEVAERSYCRRCGRRLTKEAVKEAERQAEEFSKRTRTAFDGAISYVWPDGSPSVDAICLATGCGAKHTFDPHNNTFELVPNPVPPAESIDDAEIPPQSKEQIESEAELRRAFLEAEPPPRSARDRGAEFGGMFIGCSIAIIFVLLVLMALALLPQPWTGWP